MHTARQTLGKTLQRILLVDDEPEILRELTAILQPHGYEVLTAATGADALRLARTKSPRLILLDLRMPGMDGYEALFHLKREKETAFIPVVILTAVGEVSSMFRTKDLKAADYITKPFDVDDLLRVIRRYV